MLLKTMAIILLIDVCTSLLKNKFIVEPKQKRAELMRQPDTSILDEKKPEATTASVLPKADNTKGSASYTTKESPMRINTQPGMLT